MGIVKTRESTFTEGERVDLDLHPRLEPEVDEQSGRFAVAAVGSVFAGLGIWAALVWYLQR